MKGAAQKKIAARTRGLGAMMVLLLPFLQTIDTAHNPKKRGPLQAVPVMARAIVIAAWGIAGAGHSEPVAAQDSGLQGARRTGARQVRIASERDGILQAVSGLTCKCDELMEKKKDDGRGFVKDRRVVYIYHNTVDAIGHDGKTEGHTFEAVRWTLTKLSALVGVTAGHGFR